LAEAAAAAAGPATSIVVVVIIAATASAAPSPPVIVVVIIAGEIVQEIPQGIAAPGMRRTGQGSQGQAREPEKEDTTPCRQDSLEGRHPVRSRLVRHRGAAMPRTHDPAPGPCRTRATLELEHGIKR
jgi:hypothetical protein